MISDFFCLPVFLEFLFCFAVFHFIERSLFRWSPLKGRKEAFGLSLDSLKKSWKLTSSIFFGPHYLELWLAMSQNKQKSTHGRAENQYDLRALLIYVMVRFFPLSQAPSFLMNHCVTIVAHTAQQPREHGLCGKHGTTQQRTDASLEVVPMSAPKCIFIGLLSFFFFPTVINTLFNSRGLSSIYFTFFFGLDFL